MPDITMVLGAEDAGHVRAWLNARQSIEAYTSTLGKVDNQQKINNASAKEADALQAQMEKRAKQVIDSLITPQERYHAKLKELTALRRENRLTEEQYAAAVKRSKEELDKSTSSASGGLASIATKLGTVAAGYVGISAAVSGWMQSNQQAIEEAEKFATVHDEMFRRFNVQSGLRGLQAGEAKKSILGIAEETGFLPTQAEQAATAMVSTGVSAEEASGGSLRNFLNILNAQGLHHEAPQPLVESITQYLNSQAMPVNSENMGMIGVQLQSLKDTKLKLTDMPQLAQIGAGLKGKLTEPEQISTFATLGDTLGANIASTRMQDIFKNLAVAGGKEDAVKALSEAGLKPEQIDFNGESFQAVMDTLSRSLEKLSPERQDIVLSKVIEGGNISTFRLLQQNMPLIMQRAGNLNQVDAFEADVAEGSSGRAKALTRQQVRREIRGTQRNQDGDLLIQEILDSAEEQGVDAFARDRTKGYFNTARYLGFAPKTAAGIATSLTSLPGGDVDQAMQRVAERQATALEQNNVLMQEQNDLLRNGGKKPDVAPPGQRPSSGRAQPKAQVP